MGALSKRDNKIRIGYVLKSADVGTLFSRRNSENSSHTHAYTHAYPRTHQCTPMHTRTHLHTPAHTHAYPSTPAHTRTLAHTCTHPCTPVHTCAHPRTPTHTHGHMHTPHTYPLMPADTLNLINNTKLHVNRPNTKKAREKQRKKKEGTRDKTIKISKHSLFRITKNPT